MLVVVNYGVGNLGSILNMLRKAGEEAVLATEPSVVEQATKIILPGVGAFDYGMEKLHESGMVEVLNRKVLEQKTPVLGICLGMHLMANSSEEGKGAKGLGWLDANCLKFKFDTNQPGMERLKVPNMGWNEVKVVQPGGIFREIDESPRFYFVHSFYIKCNQPQDAAATSTYGFEFTCAIRKGNITGVQFHPEKSHKFGLKILKNFASE